MKFIGLDGRTYNKSINVNKYRRKGKSRSHFQKEIGEKLNEIFANYSILEEFPCWGAGGLYLDFFIPRILIAIECDGRQHNEYIPFFHKNKSGFVKSKQNDDKKEEWCNLNNITLYRIGNIKDLEIIFDE